MPVSRRMVSPSQFPATLKHPVSNRELIFIALSAIAFRVAIFLTASALFNISFDTYICKGDGESYLAYAKAIFGDSSGLREYDRRVFPGFPALIAIVHAVGAPIGVAGLAITWVSAGIAAMLAAKLFDDRRVGWAMVMLIPHWPINSSLVMSEAPLLALALAGLCLVRVNRPIPAGLMMGLGGLVRPMACFTVMGAMFSRILRREWRSALICGSAAAAVVLAGIASLHIWTGDAFAGTRIYANDPGTYRGEIWMWPFQSLVTTPFRQPVSAWKMIYIWLHVVLTLAACGILIRQLVRQGRGLDERDAMALPWLAGNTLFVLCIGSTWGFDHFPRFTIPAMPAMFWAIRAILSQRWYWWMLIGIGSFVIGVSGVFTSP